MLKPPCHAAQSPSSRGPRRHRSPIISIWHSLSAFCRDTGLRTPGSDPSPPWLSGPDIWQPSLRNSRYLAVSYPLGSVMVSVFTYSLTPAALLPSPPLTVLEGSGPSASARQRTIIEINSKGKCDSLACKKLLRPYPSLSFSLASEFMEEKPRLLAYIGWHARVLLE